jgi:hypothetical protein
MCREIVIPGRCAPPRNDEAIYRVFFSTTATLKKPAACFARRVKLTPEKHFYFRKTEFMI